MRSKTKKCLGVTKGGKKKKTRASGRGGRLLIKITKGNRPAEARQGRPGKPKRDYAARQKTEKGGMF